MEPITPALERLRSLLAEHERGEGELAELLRELGRRQRALLDARQRRLALGAFIETLDDGTTAAVLQAMLLGAEQGRSPERELLQDFALEPSIVTEMPYDRVADLYRLAHLAGLDELRRLLLGDGRRGRPTVEEAQRENDYLPLSAGERKAIARRRDRFLLDRILHDRNPQVIRAFLDNPRAVESDVVRIAAMRPTRPEILMLVARHPRWSSRYEVRKALACNPYTPLSVARRLLPTLMLQDLHLLLATGELRAELEEAARRRIAQRRAWHAPGEEDGAGN